MQFSLTENPDKQILSKGRTRLLFNLSNCWPQLATTAAVLLAVGGVMRYGSIGSWAFLGFTSYLCMLAWFSFVTQYSGPNRLLTISTWLGGLSIALLTVLFSPTFLPLSLLCAVSAMLNGISLRHSTRRTIFFGSISTIIVIGLVMIITEFGKYTGSMFSLHLFSSVSNDFQQFFLAAGLPNAAAHATQIAESALRIPFIIGFSANILQMLWRFYVRMETNVSNLQHTNTDLASTQRELQQRLLELTKLLEVSRAISSTQDFSSLLSNTLIQLKTVVDYGLATVLLLHEDQLNEITSIGTLSNLSNTDLAQRLLVANQLNSFADVQNPILLNKAQSIGLIGSHMFIPLIVRGRSIGLLTISHARSEFYRHHDADLCMAFANQVAGLIDSARLQKTAAEALVTAERNRLSRELHDSVSQSLFGIALGTRTALEQLTQAPEAARSALTYSVDLAAIALAEMRALIFTMRPETIEQHGILVALQNQIDLLIPHYNTQIRFDAPTNEPNISLAIKEAIYRIAIEALQNALRHSKCTLVTVSIVHTPEKICLEVLDDGHGFDPTSKYSGHFGLKTMHERTSALNGVFNIDSTPNKGTRVCTTIPVQSARKK